MSGEWRTAALELLQRDATDAPALLRKLTEFSVAMLQQREVDFPFSTQGAFWRNRIADGVKAAGARAGMAVLIEPHSGQVLAMASQPDYNPNAISEYRPSQWRNRP